MSSAQEEFNQILQNSKEKASAHPEDRDSSTPSDNETEDHQNLPSDPEDYNNDMRSRNTTYQVPNTVFDANTGPKGVIAMPRPLNVLANNLSARPWEVMDIVVRPPKVSPMTRRR